MLHRKIPMQEGSQMTLQNQNGWKLLSLALVSVLLVLLATLRVEPIRADSPNNHYTVFQGTLPQGLIIPGQQPPFPTLLRLDASTGRMTYMAKNQTGVYQWWDVVDPK
jgi:hypothetical protein